MLNAIASTPMWVVPSWRFALGEPLLEPPLFLCPVRCPRRARKEQSRFCVDVVNRRLHAQRVALGEQAQVLAAHSDFRPKTFIQHLGHFDILTQYQLATVPLQQLRAGSLYGSVLAIDNRSAWDAVRERSYYDAWQSADRPGKGVCRARSRGHEIHSIPNPLTRCT